MAARTKFGLILAGAICLILLPMLADRSLYLRDILLFVYPMKLELRERLLRGELPLWNPLVGLGRPMFGMVQPGVLYPLNFLLLLRPPHGLDIFFAAHLFVIAFGMRAWMRALGVDELGQFAGGLALALSGYVLSMFAGSGSYLIGIAWVPWALAQICGSGAVVPRIARCGLFLALAILGGDPQATFFAVAVGALLAAASEDRRSAALVLVGGATLAALISCAQLLAGLETAAVGRPGGAPIADAAHFSLHPARLIELFWPGAFGDLYSSDWLAHRLYDEGTGLSYEPFAASIYVGLLVPWLATFNFLRRKRPHNVDLALLAIVILSAILALGRFTPLWPLFFRFIPGASAFRYPEKYAFVMTLALTALAARGFARLGNEARNAMKAALALVAFALVGLLFALFFGERFLRAVTDNASAKDAQVLVDRALQTLGLSALVALAFGLSFRGRLNPTRLRVALLALLFVDLTVQSLSIVDWAPSDLYRSTPPLAHDLIAGNAGAPTRLYRALHLDFAGAGSGAAVDRATLKPNCGSEYGIDHLDAYDNFSLPAEESLSLALKGAPLKFLQITATRFAILSNGQLGNHPPSSLKIVARDSRIGAALVSLDAPARIRLVEHSLPVSDIAQAARAVTTLDAAHDATIEGGEERRSTGECHVERDSPEHIEFSCSASAPAYAIVSDTFFPGWRATVDGRDADILRANCAMRAVAIPQGASRVEMHYRPRGGKTALAISILFFALALAASFTKRARRPRGLASPDC